MYLSAKTSADLLRQIVDPWYKALQDPAEAQKQVLKSLTKGYAKTLYGKNMRLPKLEMPLTFGQTFQR